jgi:CelD/BcsL family acetyltransferase involved in cellulose biosynthesis
MIIDLIDDKHTFADLRENWNKIYEIDTHATVFSSWGWLRGWIESTQFHWLLLAARQSHQTHYVGFLLLFKSPDGSTLSLGGVPESDHTSLVCTPEHERAVIKALALFIEKKLRWDCFRLREVFDNRLIDMSTYFSGSSYRLDEANKTPCPFLALPDDWDAYLLAHLSKRRRKHVRRSLRNIEVDERFRFEQPNEASLEQYIQILIALWKNRWQRNDPKLFHFFKCIVQSCFEDNSLHAITLWRLDQPIGAKLAFLDRKHKSISFYNGGWDRSYARLSPSVVMFAYNIRYAIQNGLQVCDFLRGAEPYKMKLGATIKYNQNIVITKNTLKRKIRDSLIQAKQRLKSPLFGVRSVAFYRPEDPPITD